MTAPPADSVRRSATFALLAQLSGATLTAVLTIFLSRSLSEDDYGHYAFAVAVALVAMLLADLGISSSAARFMAERSHDPVEAAAVFRAALTLKLVLGFTTAAALIGFAGPVCDVLGSPGSVSTLRWVALALVGQSLMLLCFSAFEAVQRVRFRFVVALLESVTEVGSSIALVLLGLGAAGAGLGRAIGYALGAAAALYFAIRALHLLRGRPSGPGEVFTRRILGYAGPLLLVDIAFRVFDTIDVLLISVVLGGGAQVAAFELPMRLAAFLDYPSAALTAAISPRLAALPGQRPDMRPLEGAFRLAVLLQVLFVPVLVVWPEAILHLLVGSRYPEAAGVLRALAPFVLLSSVARLATVSVSYLGFGRQRIPAALVMVAVNVVLDLLLLPQIGVVGAAVGTGAAFAIWVPWHLVILKRRTDLRLLPLAISLARASAAGVAMAAVLFLFGTGEVAVWRLLAGGALGLLAYLATLVAVREVSVTELRRLVAAVRERLGTAPAERST